MTFRIFIILGLIVFNLISCSRSKQAEFYMLNPIPPIKSSLSYAGLLIGIDSIETPAYVEKPQMIVYDQTNRVQMKEFNQWAENLDKSIKRIIKTNLTTLLRGAIIEQSPWDMKFKPDYHLQIIISDFKITTLGNSSLRASYIIYHNDRLIRKYDTYYTAKVSPVTIEGLVANMNANLTQFTRDIARTFQTLGTQ